MALKLKNGLQKTVGLFTHRCYSIPKQFLSGHTLYEGKNDTRFKNRYDSGWFFNHYRQGIPYRKCKLYAI